MRRAANFFKPRSFHNGQSRLIGTVNYQRQTSSKYWLGFGVASSLLALGYYNKDKIFADEKIEKPEKEIVDESFKYAILGSGLSTLIAAQSIREADTETPILIVGNNEVLYSRKSLLSVLADKTAEIFSIDKLNKEWFEENKISYSTDEILWLDGDSRQIILEGDKKRIISFEKCLLATGELPVSPSYPIEKEAPVTHLNTLKDAFDLREKLNKPDQTIAVIGGSMWECKLVDLLATKFKKDGIKVTQVIKEEGILHKLLPQYLSEFITKKYTKTLQSNVSLVPKAEITSIQKIENKATINFSNGESITVDRAIIFDEGKPNLFRNNSLEITDGIVCSPDLQVVDGIYTAGVVANHYNQSFGRRRLSGEDHEISSGIVAGRNLVSKTSTVYKFNDVVEYSVGGVSYKAVGKCDSSDNTHSVWAKPPEAWGYPNGEFDQNDYKIGVIYYYTDENKLVGALLWNVEDEKQHAENRFVNRIKSAKKFSTTSTLVSLLHLSEGEVESAYTE